MRTIAYIRVSRVGGRSGDSFISPVEQRRQISALAEREGLEIVDWYEELDASGGDASRPLWNKALERIEAGDIRALAVWNLSRFSRSLSDALRALERIEQAGGALFSASGDTGDDTPSGRLTRNIFLALAQMERERARDGFRVAMEHAVDRGIAVTARIPVGYLRDPETRRLVPDPLMAPVIKEVFKLRATGTSWTDLAKYHIEHGGSPKTDRAAMKWIIQNRTYLGETRQGELVNLKSHEPIVSKLLFAKANAVKGRKPKHTGKLSSQTLLGGIVRCDSCGHRMVIQRVGKGAGYACRQVTCTERAAVKAADLDSEVVSRLMAYFNRIRDARYRERGEDERLRAEAAQAKRALEEAEYDRELFVKNRQLRRLLSEQEYNEELEALSETVLETRIAYEMVEDVTPRPMKVTTLLEAWDTWNDESRREWLRETIRDLMVKSAGGKRIHVSERMALRTEGRLASTRWLLRDGYWASEPYGAVRAASRLGRRDLWAAAGMDVELP